VLVDNGSADRCSEGAASRWPWIKVVRSESNLGFAGGVHRGAEAAEGEVLVLLNDDAAAEEGLVEAHLDCLGSYPDAAVSAGRLVSWDGERHDFVRGLVTFDCHAFQLGQGRSTNEVTPPAPGETLPFACGGNIAVRRRDWERTGGFDSDLFAYFEDVELGWRLWALGREVRAAPDAVARHRGGATSSGLGDLLRGVLFERNALRIFHSCADADCRAAFGAAVHLTFVHRLTTFAAARPDLAPLVADPFATEAATQSGREPHGRQRTGVTSSGRRLLGRLLGGADAGGPVIGDGLLLMQLRATQGFFSGFEGTERRRVELEGMRKVPDREILTRFPRFVVPTYLGDDDLFQSEAFRALLPEDWPIKYRQLDQIIQR
jgi:GT2 family glycosyltransferase